MGLARSRRTLWWVLSLTAGFALWACALRTYPPQVKVKLKLGNKREGARGYPLVDGMECYYVVAEGSGISAAVSSADLISYDPACLHFGAVSELVDFATLTTDGVSLTFPAGAGRKLTAFGVTGKGASCNKNTIASQFTGVVPQIYELGSTPATDLFSNTQLQINDTYNPLSPTDVVPGCKNVINGGGTTLTLVAAYDGNAALAGSAIDWSDPVGATLPPTSSGDFNPMTAFGTASIPGYVGSADGAGGFFHDRVDLLFDMNIDLSSYTTLEVTSNAAAGTVPFAATCNVGGFSAPLGGYEMGVYGSNRAISQWAITAPAGPDGIANLTATQPVGTLTNFVTNESAAAFLHVSLRAQPTADGSNCSALQINSILAKLYP